jgi:hypothetical protein
MSLLSKRLVSIAASTLALSLVSAAAHAQAQIEFLTSSATVGEKYAWGVTATSTYTFSQSMILNSIGFATVGPQNAAFSYAFGNGEFTTISTLGTQDANGFSWYDFSSGQSIQSGTILKVKMERANATGDYNSGVYTVTGQNPAANVVYNGLVAASAPNVGLTNSNIRVSNPGSNVAPEPGSFALALTGGAALLGICVRRRRNAG